MLCNIHVRCKQQFRGIFVTKVLCYQPAEFYIKSDLAQFKSVLSKVVIKCPSPEVLFALEKLCTLYWSKAILMKCQKQMQLFSLYRPTRVCVDTKLIRTWPYQNMSKIYLVQYSMLQKNDSQYSEYNPPMIIPQINPFRNQQLICSFTIF